MKVIIQRSLAASVVVDHQKVGSIDHGYVLLLGICDVDTREDIDWLVRKIVGLRINSDAQGKMNLNLTDVDGDILLISQFTLHASTKKGNRPSFIHAASPDAAIPLYEAFIVALKKEGIRVSTGIFGADMKVALINDGPVTIIIDSKSRQ